MSHTQSRAFSLIEILISILILALGVLGLGALFPVVIREQRIGNDAVNGVTVSNNARILLTVPNWASTLPFQGTNAHPYLGNTKRLWERLRFERLDDGRSWTTVSNGLATGFQVSNREVRLQTYAMGEWFVGDQNRPMCNPNSGAARIGLPTFENTTNTPDIYFGTEAVASGVNIPMARRLYPEDDPSPQYVWDFIVQRVPGFRFYNGTTFESDPNDDGLRAAVFVRRIDQRIRTPNGETLLEAFSANPPLAFPVGEDDSGDPQRTGLPTLDGTGKYSAIRTLEVEFWHDSGTPGQSFRDRLYISPNTGLAPGRLRTEFALLRQPGQKIVDNLGNVYTVVGFGNEPAVNGAADVDGTAGGDYIKIDPPISPDVLDSMCAPAIRITTSQNDYKRAIRQIAYTAQTPVSITLVDILPRRDR